MLLTAFFAGLGLFKKDALPNTALTHGLLVLALIVIALLGILASFAAYGATNAALAQIGNVEAWWARHPERDKFPPICGTHGLKLRKVNIRGAHMLLAFAAAWAALLMLFLVGAWQTAPVA